MFEVLEQGCETVFRYNSHLWIAFEHENYKIWDTHFSYPVPNFFKLTSYSMGQTGTDYVFWLCTQLSVNMWCFEM